MKDHATITATINELQELRRLREDLDAEIEILQDAIKAHMTASDVDEIASDKVKITWRTVASNRVDTAALRKAMPEIIEQYTKTTYTKRFSITA